MRTASVTYQATAVSLALLLVACGTTRASATGPTSPEDLARYVLFITQQQDGRVTHSWRPVAEFELNTYQRQVHDNGFYGQVVNAAFTSEECRHEYEVCVPECLASTRIHRCFRRRLRGLWR